MPPHVDDESKIGIVLDGSLIERSNNSSVEATRNSVVFKPNNAVHENVFGYRGVQLLTINFKKDYPLPECLHKLDWYEDPRVSFHTYKLWYSIKSTKDYKDLHSHLNAFIQSLEMLKKTQRNAAPAWLSRVTEMLTHYSLDGETIDNISQQIKISRVHLSRTFSKHYSISAVKYRHYARMSNLLYYLVSTKKSLAEISYECGFSDQSQMSRIVLKETGYTPNALRLLLQKS